MIKRLLAIVFVCVLAFSLIGCQPTSTTNQQAEQAATHSSSNKPQGMDNNVYEKSLALYETCQDWQDGLVTTEQLQDAVNTAYEEVYIGYYKEKGISTSDVNSGPAIAIQSLKVDLDPYSVATKEIIDDSISLLGLTIGEE